MQIGKQIIGSLIAEQVANHEYELAKKQVEQSQAVEDFLEDKFTNVDFYIWMQGEVSRLYYQYYRFAVEIAPKPSRR